MKLHFERDLPCPPETAFALVSDPQRINLWSTATVRGKAPGDGGHPGGVGALREVRLPGKSGRVLEEVVEVSTPPLQLCYRVIGGAPVKSHVGEIRIAPTDGGAHLSWHVTAAFTVPGLSTIARARVAPQLGASLDRLVEVAARATPSELPPVRSLYEDDALPALYEQSAALIEAQRVLADELRAARDPRALITRAYQWLTEEGVAACREGAFQHPAWVLHLLARVHQPYAESLDRWLHRAEGVPEDYWRAVFEEAASSSHRARGRQSGRRRTVARALDALLEEDLPQALAAVYLTQYTGRCDYARFRADFYRLDRVFAALARRLDAVLDRGPFPRGARAASVFLPMGAREAFAGQRIARMTRRHRDAFERGARIVRFVAP